MSSRAGLIILGVPVGCGVAAGLRREPGVASGQTAAGVFGAALSGAVTAAPTGGLAGVRAGISGDGLLAGHGRDDDLHVDLAQPGGEWVDPGQPRLADAGQRPPETEDDAYCVMILKPNISAVPSLGTWSVGPARIADGADVNVGVRNALGTLSL
jgi:hypothetical protein